MDRPDAAVSAEQSGFWVFERILAGPCPNGYMRHLPSTDELAYRWAVARDSEALRRNLAAAVMAS